MNHVILFGNLGGDVEMKYTPQGTEVATFSMATTEKWKDAQGNKKEDTQWHRIVCWRGLAKVCAEYLKKGDQVLVNGKVTNRSYEDSNGIKRYISEVQARGVDFVRNNVRSLSKDSQEGSTAGKVQAGPADDDIPF